MKKKRIPPPKIANPIEDIECRHCLCVGMRYQGTINRPKRVSEIYRCIHCGKRNENPRNGNNARKAANMDYLLKKSRTMMATRWI